MKIMHFRTCAGLILAGIITTTLAADAIKPFNGKDLSGWKTNPDKNPKALWLVGAAKPNPAEPKKFIVNSSGNELINNTEAHGKSLDLFSDIKHGNAIIKLEVMVPKDSNSGIYVMGEYEVQVLDSHGKDKNPGPGDMGAIYGAQPPKNPRYKAPGEWNDYEIHWQAPQFDDGGKKTANAKFQKIILNGVVIHENVEMKGVTPGGVDGKEKPLGPLMFQGNHGAVSFRNIQILPLK